MTQALAALPRHIVASEPQIIDDILRAARRDPRVSDDELRDWLCGAVRALRQPNAVAVERLFIKLDAWHILSLPLLRRVFPGVPCYFVFRDPVEVMVSLRTRGA